MASTNKNRLLFLLKYFYENTNDSISVSTTELFRILKENGFKTSRNTLTDDIKSLRAANFDIICTNGANNEYSYHLGKRSFDLAELQLLIDAVSSSQFISTKLSDRLIEKIAALASIPDRKALTTRVFTADRVKSTNKQIYYIVDRIDQAIDTDRKISFKYYDMNEHRELVEKNNGEEYLNSPYALLWEDDRYYLLGYSEKHEKIVTFRVDRMKMPEILDEKRIPAPADFNPVDYAKKAFRMFDGEEQTIVLECDKDLMKNLVDKFGDNFDYELVNDKIRATVEVSVSQTFFAWLFTYAGKMKVISPEKVKAAYKVQLQAAISEYPVRRGGNDEVR